MRPVYLVLLALACAGCASAQQVASTTTTTVVHHVRPKPAGLEVGVVGPLHLNVPGVAPRQGTLAQVGNAPLVLVDASQTTPAQLQVAAEASPQSHFALVGGSTKGFRARNLVGLVLRDDQAAYLGGVVAGLVAAGQSANAPRVAWVGPEENNLAAAFGRGVRAFAPGTDVLHQWSRRIPARCKEAALTGLARGALVVMAHEGPCAVAAIAAAHQQNVPGLRLSDFELTSVAADSIARDAAAGIFHGNEDIVFGARTGTIAVGSLDPLIPLATVVQARSVASELASGSQPSG